MNKIYIFEQTNLGPALIASWIKFVCENSNCIRILEQYNGQLRDNAIVFEYIEDFLAFSLAYGFVPNSANT